MRNFDKKIVWITGASQGLGAALAHAFAQRGAIVVLSARNEEKLQQVAESLPGDEHLVLPLDMLDAEAMKAAVNQVMVQFGAIDVLVNNAGVSQRSLVKDTDISVDRQLMELDYFAVVAHTKAVLPHMLKAGSGLLVTISSIAGLVGVPYRSAYCSAKAAVIGFMDALRAEVYESGVEVAVVAPGFVQTDVARNALTADGSAQGRQDDVIENGLSPEVFAAKAMRALEKGKNHIVIAGGKEYVSQLLQRISPELLFKVIRRAKVV